MSATPAPSHTGTGTHTHSRGWSPLTVRSAVARDEFEILYPMIRGFLLFQFEAHSMPQDAVEYFTRVCQRPISLLRRSDLHRGPSVSTTTPSAATTRPVFSWSRQRKPSRDDGWMILNIKKLQFSDGQSYSLVSRLHSVPSGLRNHLRAVALVLFGVGQSCRPGHDKSWEIALA